MHLPDDADRQTLQDFFVAFSDETRLRIAATIVDRVLTIAEISEHLRLREATVARHLDVLNQRGYLISEGDSDVRRLRLHVEQLRAQRKALLTRDGQPRVVVTTDTSDLDRKVLETFYDGERLRQIPVNLKKRMVVLAWLADRFDNGVRYSEREVNAILMRHHPDVASLRRELVDQRFMQRDAGIYWRISAD